MSHPSKPHQSTLQHPSPSQPPSQPLFYSRDSPSPSKSLDAPVPMGQVAARVHDFQSRFSPSPSHHPNNSHVQHPGLSYSAHDISFPPSPHHHHDQEQQQHAHQHHPRPSISALPREAWYPQYVTASKSAFGQRLEEARHVPLPVSPTKHVREHAEEQASFSVLEPNVEHQHGNDIGARSGHMRESTGGESSLDEGFELLRQVPRGRERGSSGLSLSPYFAPTVPEHMRGEQRSTSRVFTWIC